MFTYRLPKPKAAQSGLIASGSNLPFFKNRSGSYFKGREYTWIMQNRPMYKWLTCSRAVQTVQPIYFVETNDGFPSTKVYRGMK